MPAREKQFLKLQPSEAAVSQSASTIYAAYIAAGQVVAGQEEEAMQRAVREAIHIALLTDRAVRSDDETA